MSKTLWTSEDGTLVVGRYAGSAGPPDRRRWQFTTPAETGAASIAAAELEDLLAVLLLDLKSPRAPAWLNR